MDLMNIQAEETYFEDATARTDFSRVGNCVIKEGKALAVEFQKKTWVTEEPITKQELNRIEDAINGLVEEGTGDAYQSSYSSGRLSIRKVDK